MSTKYKDTKYSVITNWILENIKPDELNNFDSNVTRCEYIISKIPSELMKEEITSKQMYFILYKYNLLHSKLEGSKDDRINWLHQHKDEILNIQYPTSKQTNNARIDYTMEHMNNDLKTNYTKDRIRNFLTHQGWLMKYSSNK